MATLSDLALRILISAKDDTGPGVKSATQGIRSISDQLQQVETIAKRFLNVRLFADWAQDGIKLSDTYAGLTGRLRQVAGETGNLSAAQQRLFDISQATQTPLEQNNELFVRSSEALKQFNNGQALAGKLAETVGLSFKAQASGASDVESTITQMTQAISTDTVQWEDFGQLADTNLLLVNTAAKNLGYDGLGALKKAMSENKVTNIDMVNAIVAGYDDIKAASDKMPVTVGGAWTMVNNALLKYVGESDKARLSTSAISSVLQTLANNFGLVADAATVIATVLGGRMLQGWLQSAAAARQAAIAAREKAAADREAAAAAAAALPQQIRRAEVDVQTSANLIKQAQLQRALATTEQQRAQAVRQLDAAYATHAGNVTALNAKTAALAAITESATQKTGLLTRGIGLLGTAFNGLFSAMAGWQIGQMIGEWLNQFEAVRKAGSYVAEAFVMIQTGAEAMLNGMSFSDRWQQIKQIHTEFEQIRANDTTAEQASAATVAEAQQQKAQATEQAAERQQAAFKQVQDATKALTAQIDADAKAQTAAIKQGLAEKLIAIDASNQLDAVVSNQKLQAQLLAAQQEIALQQATATTKAQLIDAEYQKELDSAKNNAARVNEIETEKRQAKLGVYQGVAEYYRQEIARLTELYGQETQAFAQSKQQIENLSATHQQRLLDLERQGMTERQKAASEEVEFNKTLAALKAELAKGDAASQTTINELMSRAKTLQNDITQAAINSADTQSKKSSVIYEAKQRENKLYELEKGLLETNAKAHQDNASKVQAALESSKDKLAETSNLIAGITQQLAQEYALKIGIDQASLSSAQQTIAALTAPATKTITIQTVNAGNQNQAPAQATGGLAGQPTGQPWRFSDGGWARLFGKLSGYGGGDKIQALLEPGEFIVRKEAVQKLGVPIMQLINQGQLPIQRSTGGTVGAMIDEELKKQRLEQIKMLIKQNRNDAAAYQLANGMDGGSLFTNEKFKDSLTRQLEPLMSGLDTPTILQIKALLNNLPQVTVLPTNRLTSSSGSNFMIDQAVQKSKIEGIKFDALLKNLGVGSDKPTPGLQNSLGTFPNIPSFGTPGVNGVPNQQAAGKTYTLKFMSPNGQTVNASVGSELDVSKMLDILKQSGARVGVA